MKTSRQLKEILQELKIKFDADADKEELREIAIKHDAVSKWEEKHPEKKKPKRTPGVGGGGGMPDPSNMAEMIFPMMDKNGDGRLSKEEMSMMAAQAGGGAGDADAGFSQMDTDGDGLSDDGDPEPLVANDDDDGDGLSNTTELIGLDGTPDSGDETDPLDADTDDDGDGLSDVREAELGSNPNLTDTDADGVPDGDGVERFSPLDNCVLQPNQDQLTARR